MALVNHDNRLFLPGSEGFLDGVNRILQLRKFLDLFSDIRKCVVSGGKCVVSGGKCLGPFESGEGFDKFGSCSDGFETLEDFAKGRDRDVGIAK